MPAAELERALSALPPAHLGVVSAHRPAEVSAVVGWMFGTSFDPAEENLYDYLGDDDDPDDDSPGEIYAPGVRSVRTARGETVRSEDASVRNWRLRYDQTAGMFRLGQTGA